MADGEIKIDAKIDTSQVDRGLNELRDRLLRAANEANELDESLDDVSDTTEDVAEATEEATEQIEQLAHATRESSRRNKEAADSATSFIDSLKDIFKKGGTAATVIKTVGEAIKKSAEIIRETSDAYKVQINAEKALALAAENNPYINDEGVDNLKVFASELQATSNIGDEVTLQLITRLTAAGRTQEQIEKIIVAAANASAAGAVEFESAVENLNNSLNGEAGEIADLVPEIHALTAEELQTGAAVDLLAQKYEGMAEELVDAKTQAQNAKGDFAEAIGALTAPTANAWDKFWKGFYEKGVKMINAVNDRLELLNIDNKKLLKDLDTEAYKFNAAGESGLTVQNTEALSQAQRLLNNKEKLNKITADEKQLLIYINAELRKREQAEKYALEQEQKELALQKEQTKQIEAQKQAEKERIDAQRQWHNEQDNFSREGAASLEKQLKGIRERAKLTGEDSTAQAEYNAILASYLALLDSVNYKWDESYTGVVQRKEKLDEAAEALKKYNEELAKQKEAEGLKEKAAGLTQEKTPLQQLQDESAELQILRQQINDNEILSEEEKKEALKNIDAEIAENRRKTLETYADDLSEYAGQWLQILKDTGDFAGELAETQNEAELADLEKKYKKGEIGEEEYSKKKKEIREKAARDEYAANMVSWTASLLTATANIAQGVTKAIAQGGVAGIATGALVSAAGAVQLASIIGSKPTPPKFAEGGIVGGTSYSGDNIAARVNSGEMVLTMAQQRALFDVANGRGSMGAPNITINNSASNLVKATPSISQDRINIMIDARVNESLQAGKYDTSLTMAQQGMQGKFYGI